MLERVQLLRGLEAELDESRPRLAIGGERLRLAPVAIERAHQLTSQTLS